jgi:ribosomal protein L28
LLNYLIKSAIRADNWTRFSPNLLQVKQVAEKNATKNGHIQNVCSMCIKINKVGKQEVGI